MGEVTISTSTPGAKSSSEVRSKSILVTQSGSKAYHSGITVVGIGIIATPRSMQTTGSATATLLRPQHRNNASLNQPGGKFGGPITSPGLFSGKDRAFFFVNYEEYRGPVFPL
jgi:hypothetical protein